MTWQEYQVDVPEGQMGAWEVKRFVVSEADERLQRLRYFNPSTFGRFVPQGPYTGLYHHGAVIMSDTPDEIGDIYPPIHQARNGAVLIHGLGLGVVTNAILQQWPDAQVTCIEIEPNVIDLVGRHWQKKWGDRLRIMCADALTWQPPKGQQYEVVWHDIWNDICADNLEEMKRLHRRYAKRCRWQGSWGRHLLTQR